MWLGFAVDVWYIYGVEWRLWREIFPVVKKKRIFKYIEYVTFENSFR